jgi:adenine-specific DNA methylase
MSPHYKDLIVWQKAMEAAREVYRLAPRLPREETYGMRSQITRAAVSVPANIAEGWTRGVGAREGAVSGYRAGVAGGSGDAADPLRAGGLVPGAGDPQAARAARRGGADADGNAAEFEEGNRGEEIGNRNQEIGNRSGDEPAISYLLSPTSYPLFPTSYRGAQGLAEDVRYYGQWMRDEAERRIGHLYPKVGAWREPRTGRYFGEGEVAAWREGIGNRGEEVGNRGEEVGNRGEEVGNRGEEVGNRGEEVGNRGEEVGNRGEGRGNRGELEEMAAACGYPSISYFLSSLSYQKLTVIAWLWARTVKSPNPAFADVEVPLASTFMLSTKPGKEAYVEPVMVGNRGEEIGNRAEEGGNRIEEIENRRGDTSPISYFLSPTSSPGYRFTVKAGKPKDAERAKRGTKSGGSGSDFLCLMSGTPMPFEYLRSEAKAGRMGARLMAIVAEGDRGRVYLSPTPEMEAVALSARPEDPPDTDLPAKALGFRIQEYGMTKWADLFTPRQLVALTTFSDLVQEARAVIQRDALAAGLPDDDQPLAEGGVGARAYAEAVAVYLAMAVNRSADKWATLAIWNVVGEKVEHVFGMQVLRMTWDFAEGNPLSASTGNWSSAIAWGERFLKSHTPNSCGFARQSDAQSQTVSFGKVVSTDPPYFDNVPYADLSDFFYVWLRRSHRSIYPELLATVAVPRSRSLLPRHTGMEVSVRQKHSFWMA